MMISTIVIVITGALKEEEVKVLLNLSHFHQKDGETLKNWLNKLADSLKRLAGTTAEALLIIVEM